jgi:hypothetical protein
MLAAEKSNNPPVAEVVRLPSTDEADKFTISDKQLEAEKNLIEQLRREADELKDCFTRYSFQAISIVTVALGIIIRYMHDDPIIGLAGLPIMFVPLVTLRIGSYKYIRANRNFGYELHLSRVRDVPLAAAGQWRDEYRTVSWEEAMRAWHIVQATLFREIHKRTRWPRRYVIKSRYKPSKSQPIWFCQKFLFGGFSKAVWYPGSYFAKMQGLMRWMSLGALILVIISAVAEAVKLNIAIHGKLLASLLGLRLEIVLYYLASHYSGLPLGALMAAVYGIIYYLRHYIQESARRTQVEDGFLSVHACAIIWQAVIIAHFNARQRARKSGLSSWKLAEMTRNLSCSDKRNLRSGNIQFEDIMARASQEGSRNHLADGAGLTGYTFWLGQEAESLARWASDVPGWVGLGEEGLRRIYGKPMQRLALMKLSN